MYNGGAEDIINEVNGKIVAIDDINALKDAMINIKENINFYNSDVIREDCIKRFSKEAIVLKIIEVYKEISI